MLQTRGIPAPTPAPEHVAEAVRRQLARILADPEFQSSPRACAFLRHVVERTLAGRQGEVKEATIGVEAFRRPADYDTRIDSIVRTEARRVREKLSHYYLHAGQDDPVLIEIPKGVYVPVFRVLEPARKTAGGNLWRRVALAAVVVAAGTIGLAGWRGLPGPAPANPRVMAVLPFEDQDPGGQTRYLSEGITGDLERDLAQVPGLRLRARPPANWAQRGVSYPALARKLGAGMLLAGAVIPAASGWQVRASVIRGSDGSILWTDQFPLAGAGSCQAPCALAAEREIEHGAAKALGITLPALRHPAENPRAHDLYLQGRNLWAVRSRESNEQAIELYRQALAIDPNYALAYMGIADAYALLAGNGQMRPDVAIREGEAAAAKAIALDPSLAEAHAALGLLKGIDWDYPAAAAEYQRAIELNPSYDRAYIRAGTLHFSLGDFAGAEKLMRQAETLNPYSMALPMIRAELYYYSRRYPEAIDLSRQVLRMDPRNPIAPRVVARVLFAQGKPREALASEQEALHPGAAPAAERAELASYECAAGRCREAGAALDEVVRWRDRDFVDAYALATDFARMGEREQALEWIERALAEHSADFGSVRWDPAFDFVRGEPRFQAAVRKGLRAGR